MLVSDEETSVIASGLQQVLSLETSYHDICVKGMKPVYSSRETFALLCLQ